jgi:hypothetical protein
VIATGGDLVVGFEMSGDPPQSAPLPSRFEIVMPRDTNAGCSRVYVGGEPVAAVSLSVADDGGGNMVVVRGASPKNPIVALRPISELGKALSRMLYLGLFRNAVNIGGSGDYYDIQIGQPFITNWNIRRIHSILWRRM